MLMGLEKGIEPNAFRFVEMALSANQMVGRRGMNCLLNLGIGVTKFNLCHNIKVL
jgi:hypothetical protein